MDWMVANRVSSEMSLGHAGVAQVGGGSRLTQLMERIRHAIPEGRSLPEDVWQRRHRGFLILLWLHAIGLAAFALIQGAGLGITLTAAALPSGAALLAQSFHARKLQASIVSLGFLTSSAMLVYISGGYIEMHFHYFVMVTLLALYQDWTPFLLAVGYVLLQHGVGGVFMPHSVYNHPNAWDYPWKWAMIHATFLAAACVGSLVAWRVNERHHTHTELLLNSMGEGLYGLDLHGKIVFANAEAAKLTGYAVGQLLNRSSHALFHHTKADGTPYPEDTNPISISLASGESRTVIGEVFWRKDGTNFPVEYRCNPIRDRGQLVGATVTFFDITERIRVTRELQASTERFRSLMQSANDGIVIADHNGIILSWNKGASRIFGYNEEEVLGHPLTLLMPERYREGHRAGLERMRAGGNPRVMGRTVELHGLRKDGEEFPVELSLAVWVSEQESFYSGIIRDITERTRLETQLRQAQKMEGLGRLAGGIAHDFNNLLTVIDGYSHLMQQSLLSDAPQHNDVDQIRKAADRAAMLTNQLLAFSRQQLLQPTVLDLNTVVAQMDQLLRRVIGENMRLSTRLDPGLGRIKADKGQLEQVIMNLAVNARDAMPDGGQLTIETQNVEIDRDYARHHAPPPLGPYVMLAVSDTGVGMDAATQANAFEPFFTTKEIGKGTGLGLATVYGIVKQSGGFILVYSEVGRGSTFKIYLPRIDEVPVPLADSHADETMAGGTECVLVVEDEEMVRMLAQRVLRARGYHVLIAENGDEALQVAEAHRGRIHLLVTDMVMPGMTGQQLAERVVAARPETKVLYVSGYTNDAIVRHWMLEVGTAFLQKPYSPVSLTHKVREVLDSRPN